LAPVHNYCSAPSPLLGTLNPVALFTRLQLVVQGEDTAVN
jgi:hypothetical protein